MIVAILKDGALAAVAAIGFGIIADPPLRALPSIALLGALGHSFRFVLMNICGIDIATASLLAAFAIGMSSLMLGKRIYCPITILYIPALLPMIPGMFAYKTVFSLMLLMQNVNHPELESRYVQDLILNGVITGSVVFMLAVGATIPLALFKGRAYTMTRHSKYSLRRESNR